MNSKCAKYSYRPYCLKRSRNRKATKKSRYTFNSKNIRENNLFTVEVLNVNELESVKGGKTVITKTETRPDGTVVTTRIELD